MANKNNNVNFDIPVPIIIMAFIFCWPVGIVLTILRSISLPANRNNVRTTSRADVKSSFERTESRKGSQQKNRGKGKNVSAATKTTRFFSIFLGILSLVTLCAFAGSSAGLSVFLRDFLSGVCPMLIGAVSCGIAAKLLGDRDTRFGRIRAIIGNRESINLTKLAAASNEKLKNVRKDVQKLIDNGEFGEYAYIDLGTNNFMRSPYAEPDEPEQFDFRKVYGDVLKKEKKEPAAASEEISTENTSKEADSDDFGKIISEIRRLNDEIADEQVSERIYRIEEHTKNIFEYVTDHPESMPQIRTFMNYYLPTTLKLLESYSRIERVGVAGENMK
ncbi:MAG: 5-bromo-4-chloroindolyl phosphate hydrolysis family protein, partial [Clostridia bacterium]|nr:5-bromo-4-chloroindolyl phosphate hydrolysis family protein [Clostridia bacterium]